jgi:hypothetical protein
MYGAVNYGFGAAACYFMGAYGGLPTRSRKMCISVGEGVQKAFNAAGIEWPENPQLARATRELENEGCVTYKYHVV